MKMESWPQLEDLRTDEVTQIMFETNDGHIFAAWYSNQYSNKL
jgi:hypothetical protein